MKQTEKKIEDYLHLYLGCEIQTPDGIGKLHSVSVEPNGERSNRIKVFFGRMIKTENSIDGYNKHRNHGSYLIEQESYVGINAPEGTPPEFTMPGGCKPILRPLSDIDKNEVADLLGVEGFIKRGNFENPFFQVEYEDLKNERQYKHQYLVQMSPEQFIFLLSKHFDLFGLIESGLAIDKTKL